MKRTASICIEFFLALIGLLAGVILISLLCAHFGINGDGTNKKILEQVPLGKLVIAMVFVPMAETAIWSVAFVELAIRFFKHAWVGVLLGALAYGVGFHWFVGIGGKLVATWLGIVTIGIYAYERKHSRLVAYACSLGLRWSFVAVGIALARSGL